MVSPKKSPRHAGRVEGRCWPVYAGSLVSDRSQWPGSTLSSNRHSRHAHRLPSFLARFARVLINSAGSPPVTAFPRWSYPRMMFHALLLPTSAAPIIQIDATMCAIWHVRNIPTNRSARPMARAPGSRRRGPDRSGRPLPVPPRRRSSPGRRSERPMRHRQASTGRRLRHWSSPLAGWLRARPA